MSCMNIRGLLLSCCRVYFPHFGSRTVVVVNPVSTTREKRCIALDHPAVSDNISTLACAIEGFVYSKKMTIKVTCETRNVCRYIFLSC